MFNKKNPIIIIGMHRSGTTMLSKILHEYGIYFGINVEDNNESIPYLKCNEQIFKENNSEWFNVRGLKSSILNSEKKSIKLAKKALTKRFKEDYLKGLNQKDYVNYDKWGWKDPRNTFTIDIWRKIYPKAKVIHIFRNPVDVASSLRNREIKFDNSSKLSWIYHTQKFKFKNGFYISRCPSLKNLEFGYELWKSYVKEALSQKDVLHIKYEDILTNKEFELNKIFQFINFKRVEFNNTPHNFKIINSKKFSFIKDSEKCEFYNSIKEDDIIKKLGYHNII